MRGTRKRALSLLLALSITLCLLPVGATAAGLESRDLTFELAMSADMKSLGLFQGGKTFTRSQPIGVRVVPLEVK